MRDRSRDSRDRLRVLVVDDDHLQLRAIGRALQPLSDRIELNVIGSADEALTVLGRLQPELIVMDVHMADLDGIEACRRIKANPATAGTTVVLASAGMTPALEAEALAAGALRALAKPFDPAAVVLDELAPRAVGTIPPPIGRQVAVPRPAVRAADVLVAQLVEAGVEVVFGLPGGPVSPIHDALLDSRIRVVTVRHESGAMFAAAGYAHTTGRLAVAVVTSGPGILNAVTGLASAWCDGLPLLLLAGEAPRSTHGRGVLQDGSAYGLNVVAMTSHVAKLAVEVPSATQLPHLVRRAIGTALSGRRGPVVLTLPMDVTTTAIAPPVLAGHVTLDAAVPSASFDELAAVLRAARRPMILAGSGVRRDGAPALLRHLAERLGCPVATTPKAKGVFPESSPLSLGVYGLGGHPSAHAYLGAGVDVLLAIGTSLGDLSTDGFSAVLQAPTLIHVDLDGRQFGRSYAPTHAVVASAADFLAAVEGRLEEAPRRACSAPPAGVVRHAIAAPATPGRVAPHEALAAIQAVLPPDTIYTVDSGEHFQFATHFLHIDHPDAFVVMTGLGSMGQSIGAAVGAQLAHGARTVAAIVGDGCFAMNAFEVATAAAERLPLRVFVFHDGGLGMVENGHEAVYGRRPRYSTDPLDVCRVAAGLGAATAMVTSVAELRALAPLLRDHPGPVVVDVRVDPSVRLPRKDRMGAFAPASSSELRPAPPLFN